MEPSLDPFSEIFLHVGHLVHTLGDFIMALLQLLIFLENKLFKKVYNLTELVVFKACGLLRGWENNEAILLESVEKADQLEYFNVELSFVHVADYLLVVHHPFISRSDNGY